MITNPRRPLNAAISRRAKENQEHAEREAIRIRECKSSTGTDAQKMFDAWFKSETHVEADDEVVVDHDLRANRKR